MIENPAMAIRHIAPIVAFSVALAGCGSIGAIDLFKRRDAQHPLPPPVDQSALAPVDASQLPPLTDGTQVAALPPGQQPLPLPGAGDPASPPPTAGIGRTDLL